MSWLDLEEKVAIVTGGACGIGRAVCRGLAEVGVKIVVADIDEQGAGKLAIDLKKQFGGEHIATKTDVTDKPSIDATVKAALDAFGKVDILVNNAGILIPRLLVDPASKEELTEQIWDKMVSINPEGSLHYYPHHIFPAVVQYRDLQIICQELG